MKRRNWTAAWCAAAVMLLAGAVPALAQTLGNGSIYTQCPGDTTGDFVPDEVDNAHPTAHCMHLAAGDGPSLERDFLAILPSGWIHGWRAEGAAFIDIGTPASLAEAGGVLPAQRTGV